MHLECRKLLQIPQICWSSFQVHIAKPLKDFSSSLGQASWFMRSIQQLQYSPFPHEHSQVAEYVLLGEASASRGGVQLLGRLGAQPIPRHTTEAAQSPHDPRAVPGCHLGNQREEQPVRGRQQAPDLSDSGQWPATGVIRLHELTSHRHLSANPAHQQHRVQLPTRVLGRVTHPMIPSSNSYIASKVPALKECLQKHGYSLRSENEMVRKMYDNYNKLIKKRENESLMWGYRYMMASLIQIQTFNSARILLKRVFKFAKYSRLILAGGISTVALCLSLCAIDKHENPLFDFHFIDDSISAFTKVKLRVKNCIKYAQGLMDGFKQLLVKVGVQQFLMITIYFYLSGKYNKKPKLL